MQDDSNRQIASNATSPSTIATDRSEPPHAVNGCIALNALNEVPDRKGRLRSGVLGLGLTLGLGAALVTVSNHVAPARRLLSEVLPIELIGERPRPPLKPDLAPPAPAPEPPPVRATPARTASAPPVLAPPQNSPQDVPNQVGADAVGLDLASFGTGSGGPAFYAGTTQMGMPGQRAVASAFAPPPVQTPRRPTSEGQWIEAKLRAGNPLVPYPESARRRNVEGLMVIEAELDERGRVTHAAVRGKLDPELDAIALRTLETWTFEPATSDGTPVASTKFVRVRFVLE